MNFSNRLKDGVSILSTFSGQYYLTFRDNIITPQPILKKEKAQFIEENVISICKEQPFDMLELRQMHFKEKGKGSQGSIGTTNNLFQIFQ